MCKKREGERKENRNLGSVSWPASVQTFREKRRIVPGSHAQD